MSTSVWILIDLSTDRKVNCRNNEITSSCHRRDWVENMDYFKISWCGKWFLLSSYYELGRWLRVNQIILSITFVNSFWHALTLFGMWLGAPSERVQGKFRTILQLSFLFKHTASRIQSSWPVATITHLGVKGARFILSVPIMSRTSTSFVRRHRRGIPCAVSK